MNHGLTYGSESQTMSTTFKADQQKYAVKDLYIFVNMRRCQQHTMDTYMKTSNKNPTALSRTNLTNNFKKYAL